MEKDIENLARGEVQSGKWNYEVLEVDGSLEERACVVGVCQRHHWGKGHSFPSHPAERITLWVRGTEVDMQVERVYWKFGFLQASLEGPSENEELGLDSQNLSLVTICVSLQPHKKPELFLKNKMVGGCLFQERVRGYFSLWIQCITLHKIM